VTIQFSEGAKLLQAAFMLGRTLPVFPCAANKKPLTRRGLYDATMDQAQIRVIFWPDGAKLIGVPTGRPSGIVALDLDRKPDRDGVAWAREHQDALPRTRAHRTPSGGLHLLFKLGTEDIRNSAGKIAPGVDVRGTGGYIIFPPSPGYTVARDEPMAEFPEWIAAICRRRESMRYAPPSDLIDKLRQSNSNVLADRIVLKAIERVQMAKEGTRNDTLNKETFWLGRLVCAGVLDRASVEGMMWQAGMHIGLPSAEVLATVTSALRGAGA